MPNDHIRVLVVDDALDRDGQIRELLVAAGFDTRVVNDSVAARGALEIWRPAVVVVDLRFPASEAHRFCADLAARQDEHPADGAATLSPPVILVAEGPNLLKPAPIVPAGLIPTPVDADQMIATVNRVARDADLVGGAIASR